MLTFFPAKKPAHSSQAPNYIYRIIISKWKSANLARYCSQNINGDRTEVRPPLAFKKHCCVF